MGQAGVRAGQGSQGYGPDGGAGIFLSLKSGSLSFCRFVWIMFCFFVHPLSSHYVPLLRPAFVPLSPLCPALRAGIHVRPEQLDQWVLDGIGKSSAEHAGLDIRAPGGRVQTDERRQTD